jgi:hypothetical protein
MNPEHLISLEQAEAVLKLGLPVFTEFSVLTESSEKLEEPRYIRFDRARGTFSSYEYKTELPDPYSNVVKSDPADSLQKLCEHCYYTKLTAVPPANRYD